MYTNVCFKKINVTCMLRKRGAETLALFLVSSFTSRSLSLSLSSLHEAMAALYFFTFSLSLSVFYNKSSKTKPNQKRGDGANIPKALSAAPGTHSNEQTCWLDGLAGASKLSVTETLRINHRVSCQRKKGRAAWAGEPREPGSAALEHHLPSFCPLLTHASATLSF